MTCAHNCCRQQLIRVSQLVDNVDLEVVPLQNRVSNGSAVTHECSHFLTDDERSRERATSKNRSTSEAVWCDIGVHDVQVGHWTDGGEDASCKYRDDECGETCKGAHCESRGLNTQLRAGVSTWRMHTSKYTEQIAVEQSVEKTCTR